MRNIPRTERVRCVLFVMVTLFSSASLSQVNDRPKELTVNSNPPGAIVHIDGEYSIVGRTPYVVPHQIVGKYKVKAYKSGYETWSSTVQFLATNDEPFVVYLSPRTRWKAGLRSFLFPGWGQVYSERKARGIMISVVQWGAMAAAFIADRRYQNARNDYEEALRNYRRVQHSFEEGRIAWQVVTERFDRVDDTYRRRRALIWFSAGIWMYNILDSVLFFPTSKRELLGIGNLEFSGGVYQSQPKIGLNLLF